MPAKKNTAKSEATPIGGKLEVRRDDKGKIWSHVRNRWLVETPEERVRQGYLCVLVNEYGFALDQIDEELSVTGRGSGNARADFLIWRTPADKRDGKTAFVVVECKADNVTIDLSAYEQGANYAQYERSLFFVTHNHRETRFFKVDLARRSPNYDEIENIPHADASDEKVKDLLKTLKVFKEDEFARLLHQCHNVIRNREKLDPAAAFDEIAKILFIKVDQERRLRKGKARENRFTAVYLDEQKDRVDDPVDVLFKQTKRDYEDDRIFEPGEKVNLRFNTVREIVRLLEIYDLSATSEDIKGIAFERFLGKTFRGEIGQFFTPRPIVEFMVRMVAPQEGDVICDPASGSGGFLIRFFELVRQQILADADKEYQGFKAKIDGAKKPQTEKAHALTLQYDAIQARLKQDREGSRLWTLANRCIYGTDANDRMARTSKMNMIMHGDGHGGVHHHDGFLNVNGIFEGRFDIILTNPPFGASVEPSDVVTDEQVAVSADVEREYSQVFGDAYREAQARVRAAKGKPIASLFELPKARGNGDGKAKLGKIKTEILFIERCLSLLKPGGRLGIVLPEGILNNPSLAYVRRFCEDRAFIRAVVSLPQDTFVSSGASVKASLLFMQRFTENEQTDYDRKKAAADEDTRAKYADDIQADAARLEAAIDAAKVAKDAKKHKDAKAALAQFQRNMEDRIQAEGRAMLKERFPYPVFLYEAQHVGLTATNEPDTTELYEDPNLGLPAGVTADATAVELYRAFRVNPEAFLRGQA